jgi:hypothetical protein
MAHTTEQTPPNLKEIMERERERLTELRRDVAAQLEALDAMLCQRQREPSGIAATHASPGLTTGTLGASSSQPC